MKSFVAICFLTLIAFLVASCSREETISANNQVASSKSKALAQQPIATKHEATQGAIDKKDKLPVEKRKYKFPSMMVKEDMHREGNITEDRRTSLLSNLVVNGWSITRDRHGRLCKYVSPEITYLELRGYLNFNDSDVTYIQGTKTGEPQAVIQTEWLTCRITFLNKIYDGKDGSVRLKAVLIDNEVQANANREAEYDRNKGVIRRMLDFFRVEHQ